MLQDSWGRGAADVVTVLILVTAFASVFTGLLGGSRVPFDAARDPAARHPDHARAEPLKSSTVVER